MTMSKTKLEQWKLKTEGGILVVRDKKGLIVAWSWPGFGMKRQVVIEACLVAAERKVSVQVVDGDTENKE